MSASMSTSASNSESSPRAGTVVWGAILTLTGLAVLALGFGVDLDLQAVLIVLLAVAGVGLLVKALARQDRTPSEPEASWATDPADPADD